MKKPLSEILSEALAIVEKSTPGELSVYDANEGDGWPPRPLWCFKNEAYDSEDEEAAALQGSVHYGGKEDAEAIAAAINFLRHHGNALAALARRVEGAGDGRRIAAARDAWQSSAEAQMLASDVSGPVRGAYLRNRLEVAFCAGYDAALAPPSTEGGEDGRS